MRDSADDVGMWALRTALADMPEEFQTKDLSNHAEMRRVHAKWMDEREARYHQMVGVYLSQHRDELGIEKITSTPNARWRKRPAAAR